MDCGAARPRGTHGEATTDTVLGGDPLERCFPHGVSSCSSQFFYKKNDCYGWMDEETSHNDCQMVSTNESGSPLLKKVRYHLD